MDSDETASYIASLLKLAGDVLESCQRFQNRLSVKDINDEFLHRYEMFGLRGEHLTLYKMFKLNDEVSTLQKMLQYLSALVGSKEAKETIIPETLLLDCRETLNSSIKTMWEYDAECGSISGTRGSTRRRREETTLLYNLTHLKSLFEVIINIYATVPVSRQLEQPRAKYMPWPGLTLEKMRPDPLREKILLWLSLHNFDFIHWNTCAIRSDDTCDWLIQSSMFSSWRRSDGGVFILNGFPGTGKSVLFSRVIQELKLEAFSGSSQAVAYFYIDYREDAHPMLDRVTSTLLRQLLHHLPKLPLDIIRIYKETIFYGRKPTYMELVEGLISVATKFRQVYVCFDALDELAEREQQSLLKLVEEFSKAKICVFISSRVSHCLDIFLRRSWLEVRSIYQQDISQNRDHYEDITRYIESKRVIWSRHLKGELELQEQINHKISASSHGMFLWVAQVLQELEGKQNLEGMEESINTMPVELYHLYDRLLRRMEAAIDDQKRLAICGMLKTALQSQKSFEVSLNTATLIEACGGFVFVESPEADLFFIHFTAREFLASKAQFMEVDLPARAKNISERQGPFQKARTSFNAYFLSLFTKAMGYVSENEMEETASRGSQSWIVLANEPGPIFSQMESVTDQFAKLLATRKDLRPTILECLEKQGVASFKHSFSKLLQDYSRELQLIAEGIGPSEQVAALMVGQRIRAITEKTVIVSGYLGDVKSFPQKPGRVENSGIVAIDRVLQDTGRDSRNEHLSTLTNENGLRVSEEKRKLPSQTPSGSGTEFEDPFGNQHEQAEEGEIHGEVLEAYANVQRLQQFLTFNAPFAKLIEQLRQQPKDQPPKPLIEVSEPEPNLLVKPVYGNSQRKETAKISAWVRTFWEYKLRPALGGEVPLVPGMTRVRWTCVCDRRYYDDFIEIKPGAIAQLQASLNEIYRREIQAVPAQSTSVWLRMWKTKPDDTSRIIIVPAHSYRRRSIKKIFIFKVYIINYVFLVTLIFRAVLLPSALGQFEKTTLAYSAVLWFSLLFIMVQMRSEDDPKSSSPGIEKTLSHSLVADYPGLLKSESVTRSPANNQDGNTGESRTAGSSQRQGLNLLESGDLSMQRLPAESADAGGRREQNPNPSEVRTHDGPGAEERNAKFEQALWVIPCFRNSNGDDQVIQVSVTDKTSDGALFSRFRQEYFRISSWWRRFVKMQEVTAIRFVMLGLIAGEEPQEYIADIRQTDVWPPKTEPQIWLYDPCPAVKIPLVGQRYLMKIWRESHHADRSTFEEWRQHAAWYDRAVDWIRHVFPRWVQKLLGDWGLDPNAGKLELGDGIRPSGLSRVDFQQPKPAQRSRYAIVAIPKKIGMKVEPDPSGVKREEVWGLQFEESFTIHRLLFYVLVLYFLGSIVAIVHLYQEATTPISMANKLWIFGWVASFVTLLLTVWLKWAETPK